jgi:hypothetical protein
MIGDPRLPANFWTKVAADVTGCWLWTGALNSRGYGQFGVNGKSTSTHRISYELFVGPIPEGLTIDHLCRVKACCNPAHLEAVTGAENTRRAYADLTECANGHPYTQENTARYGKRKRRDCLTCRRAENKRYRDRKRNERLAAAA